MLSPPRPASARRDDQELSPRDQVSASSARRSVGPSRSPGALSRPPFSPGSGRPASWCAKVEGCSARQAAPVTWTVLAGCDQSAARRGSPRRAGRAGVLARRSLRCRSRRARHRDAGTGRRHGRTLPCRRLRAGRGHHLFLLKTTTVRPLGGVRAVTVGGRAVDSELSNRYRALGECPLTERETVILHPVVGHHRQAAGANDAGHRAHRRAQGLPRPVPPLPQPDDHDLRRFKDDGRHQKRTEHQETRRQGDTQRAVLALRTARHGSAEQQAAGRRRGGTCACWSRAD